MKLDQAIANAISTATGEPFSPSSSTQAGGGCINNAIILSDKQRSYFVKLNSGNAAEQMFASEAQALRELAEPRAIVVPRPITYGSHGNQAFLVIEHLDLGGRGSKEGYRLMGEQLAALHAAQGKAYGWHSDNFIGSTPQPNAWLSDWAEFFRTHRLEHQLNLAERRGAGSKLIDSGRKLAENLDDLLSNHTPAPSLLHGDLWGGNADFTRSGSPAIYDPATYYGDRETDLAMAELFGGFPASFHEGYESAWPLQSGYTVRRELYQLYHVLNHYNLFGGMYRNQARRQIDSLLAHLGH
ncbi:fructosamine kinase family protein [Halorhodospira halochloris]|uniref:Ribulosamine/erythrulosamine 3-kinase n=1 Tax=Halorhodospira halochloris TaxID=1052 RepID=A0A0X8X747_HALHR|nr:fructosamine kinase family protein [Halorhodospira halochloris]MBK1650662.1 hypothetical protein [Halorhodospira halochloris]MCG5529771.1 fructosamine kinase family protein [Halorhodospira halochloris]BAU56850.1 ribulosamine/erythrulosamine 3-kinase [Halorhodospira halochloris]